MKFNLFKYFFLLSITLSFAQEGIVSGKIIDQQVNDVFPFVDVILVGTTQGAISDIDGNYALQTEPGTYELEFRFVGYTTKRISGVVIKSGQETIVDVTLEPSSDALEATVINATAKKNTETSITRIQKESTTVVDGLSLQTIRKTGASNVASAVKQIPGVSIEGGKYVYVRGLGDRYTKTTLNGLDIPGLDPDRNALQVDIFPTNILDNIIVNKTASAEFPADFTGGVVDIALKEFSNKPEYSISLGAGYNSQFNLNDQALNYEGGKTDFLGIDDGTRDVPLTRTTNIPSRINSEPANAPSLVDLTNRFEKQLRADQQTSLPNFGIGFTAGGGYNVGGGKLGYQALLNYKNNTEFYQNAEDGIFVKNIDPDVNELFTSRLTSGRRSINETLLTGLAGLSYKINNTKIKFTALQILNGTKESADLAQAKGESGQGGGFLSTTSDALLFTERGITNLFVGLKQRITDDFTASFKYSPTWSKVNDLDHRVTPLLRLNEDGNDAFVISRSDTGTPIRIWRFLEETNHSGKLDLELDYPLLGEKSRFKFGGAFTLKNRDFSIDDYTFDRPNSSRIPNGDTNFILRPENIFNPDTRNGTSLIAGDFFEAANAFDATQNILGAYISTENRFFEKLKTIIGIRLENFQSLYTGQDNLGNVVLNDAELINELEFYPSANLIYEVTNKFNTRVSYSKTTARPSFKEAALSSIFDPVTNRRFTGALAFGKILVPTLVDNFDLRLEYFGEKGDVFAISSFYKKMENPIELTFAASAPGEITPVNIDEATIIGLEIEVKKHFGFISEFFEDFRIKTNWTLIDSQTDIPESELLFRNNTAKTNETVSDTRPLQGQATYLFNTSLDYNNSELGLDVNLAFNVQGESLQIVASNNEPDVFTRPFNSLNLNVGKKIGNHSISGKIENILDDDRESLYQSFGNVSEVFSRRSPSRTFSLSYSYKF